MQLRTTKERKQRTKLCSQRVCVPLLVAHYFLLSWYRRIRELRRVSQTVASGVLVSYVYHENENGTFREVRNKRRNLHIFVKKGYIDDARYTFIFTISGRWPSTKEFFHSIGTHEETSILPVSSNVITVTRSSTKLCSDLCHHGRTCDKYKASFGAFVFLNDGVRGPFTSVALNTNLALGSWLYQFLRLATDPRVSVVGSAVSCEISWHVQTYFIVIKRALVDDLFKMWLRSCSEQDWSRMVRDFEVGPSQTFLERGFAIASPSSGRVNIFTGTIPQTSCRNPSTVHVGLEKGLILKYGGEVFRKHFIHSQTMADVANWTMLNFPYLYTE